MKPVDQVTGIRDMSGLRPLRTATTGALLCLAALLTWRCGSCDERDDETRIRELIDKAAAFASQKNIKELMRLTTPDFKASPGGRDRRATKGVLFVAFQKYQKFSVRFPRPTVEVDPSGRKAEASTPFLIVRDERDAPGLSELFDDPQNWIKQAGEIADLYILDIWLTKSDDEWLVNKVRLQGYRRLGDL